MPIKTLGSLEKIRVGRVTGNTFFFFLALCPQQMLVHKGGKIKNSGGECRDVTPSKLQCQNIQRALQVFNKNNNNNNYKKKTQRINGPVYAHLIYWPSKAQNIQNLENIW